MNQVLFNIGQIGVTPWKLLGYIGVAFFQGMVCANDRIPRQWTPYSAAIVLVYEHAQKFYF